MGIEPTVLRALLHPKASRDLPLPAREVRLFCSDIDGTLLGNPTAAQRFTAAWHTLPAEGRPLLVYNTGRTLADVVMLQAAGMLPRADFVIGSVGTEFGGAGGRFDLAFRDRPCRGWQREQVERIMEETPGVRRQPAMRSNPRKSSWYWERATGPDLCRLEQRLTAAGLEFQLVYSCREFLDIVPASAGKGATLQWLCALLGLHLEEVLVAGDSANDTGMFSLPGIRGIVVGNALPELLREIGSVGVYSARQWMAEGVIEGLQHYGVMPSAPGPRAAAVAHSHGMVMRNVLPFGERRS